MIDPIISTRARIDAYVATVCQWQAGTASWSSGTAPTSCSSFSQSVRRYNDASSPSAFSSRMLSESETLLTMLVQCVPACRDRISFTTLFISDPSLMMRCAEIVKPATKPRTAQFDHPHRTSAGSASFKVVHPASLRHRKGRVCQLSGARLSVERGVFVS
jgi:hypothetical protein